MNRPRRRVRLWIGVGFAAWILAVGAGLTMLWAYAGTPGPAASAPLAWPAGTFAREAGKPALVLFLHPHCPCSRATLSELARLLVGVGTPPAVYALVYRPSDAAAGWEHTDLWDAAERIPGVHVMTDAAGAQADRFGANVSGETLLYDAAGALRFSGGITGARGHEGDNPGRAAVSDLLNGRQPPIARTPSFGCLLHAEVDARVAVKTGQAPR